MSLSNQAPKFSVVIPVHNREEAIGEALRSVLAQTVQDFEILVVDDGSTDQTETAVAAVDDQRIRFIRQDKAGANAARNRGIDEARGAYIALLDSDDRFVPEHLERAAGVLSRQPDAVVFARIIVDRGGGKTFLKPPRGPRPGENIGEYLICAGGFVQTSTVVLAVGTARAVRYLEGLRAGQDMDFAIRLGAAGYRFEMIAEPGAVWSDKADPSRISAKSSPETRLHWLERSRPYLTDRAYYGFRGWFLAKAYAQTGQQAKALTLFAAAVRRRCYAPGLAARILLQVALVNGSYRRLADLTISRGKSA